MVVSIAVFATIATEEFLKNNRGDFFILEQGAAVPDFQFTTLDGVSRNLYDFKGQKIIIHFWASWCAPCVVEFPELVSLAQDNPDIVIMAFSSDKTAAAIDRFLSVYAPQLPKNFLMIHDADGQVTKDKFSVFQLPESFVISQDGLLQTHIVGAYKGWDSFID